MRYYPFPEKKSTKVLTALFLAALLFLARDTLVTSSILGFNKSQFAMLGLICIAGVLFLVHNRSNWKDILLDKRMVLILASAIIVLLPMIVKQDWQMMYLSVLLCLLTAVFLTYFISFRELAKYYILILTVLGVYSIVAMWILRPLLIDTGMIAPFVDGVAAHIHVGVCKFMADFRGDLIQNQQSLVNDLRADAVAADNSDTSGHSITSPSGKQVIRLF